MFWSATIDGFQVFPSPVMVTTNTNITLPTWLNFEKKILGDEILNVKKVRKSPSLIDIYQVEKQLNVGKTDHKTNSEVPSVIKNSL